MFSGIIEAVGTVARVDRRGGGIALALRVPESLRGLAPGSSVAVNGTCLTVVKAEGDTLTFDAVGATMTRTLLGSIEPGSALQPGTKPQARRSGGRPPRDRPCGRHRHGGGTPSR